MSLTADEQELLEIGKSTIPEVFRSDERTMEDLIMFAKAAGAAKRVGQHWLDMARIGLATGPVSTEYVDWLALHAQERGTSRRDGESDDTLKQRLWSVPGAVIRSDILTAVNAILASAGISGTASMEEMPRDAAYFGNYTADSGTGGKFAKSGDTMTFTPTVRFAYPPFFKDISGIVVKTKITISGADSAGNDGTFEITGIDGDGVQYTNASGVSTNGSADTGAGWSTSRYSAKGDDGCVLDGYGRTHFSRGYRMWRGAAIGSSERRASPNGFIIVLPYGTTESVRKSVAEMCRQLKAAGFTAIVERREAP